MANIKVHLPFKGEITLSAQDHLATGGEGAVYLKNNLIFKLFLDPAKAQARGMQDKIKLLSSIKHPYIISPLDILCDAQHQMIGYYMNQAEGIPLMKTFTNSWRDLNHFEDKQAATLVENMRIAVQAAHAMGAVMVDGNETNYLANGVEPRIIDIDSWQIGRHSATAIMPSIKDYHADIFDQGSDWFSWAIVSFQVFTGIHPYKGTHPQFKKGDLEGRMRANASVFDPGIKLNTAVRPFSVIPSNLLAWYEHVFSKGERTEPPSVVWSPVTPSTPRQLRVIQSANGVISHEKLHQFPGDIKHVSGNGVAYYLAGAKMQAFDLYRKQAISKLAEKHIEALFCNQAGLVRHADGFVFVEIVNNGIRGTLIAGDKDPVGRQIFTNELTLSTSKLVVMGNRLFALNTTSARGMVELELLTIGSKVSLAVKQEWPIHTLSTQFFDGVGLMDCVGMPFLVIPEGEAVTLKKAEVLKEYKIINGYSRHSHHVLLIGMKRAEGKCYKIELRFKDKDIVATTIIPIEDADLNIAVTAKGIAASIEEDGEILVQNTRGVGEKRIKDTGISQEMRLFSMLDGVYYRKDASVFKLTLA